MTDIADNNFVPGLTAQALEVQVDALQNYLASLVVQQPGSGLQVVQAPAASSTVAVVTGTPTVVDNRTLRVAAGLVIGLVLGALAALGLWLLDKRLKTAKRAQVALGYPVVAEIPVRSERFDRGLSHALAVGLPRAPPSPAGGAERTVVRGGGPGAGRRRREPVRAGGEAVSEPVTQPALERSSVPHSSRRVVMVASAGPEPTLADVATNLATVCAEIGQRVALLSTAGLDSLG